MEGKAWSEYRSKWKDEVVIEDPVHIGIRRHSLDQVRISALLQQPGDQNRHTLVCRNLEWNINQVDIVGKNAAGGNYQECPVQAFLADRRLTYREHRNTQFRVH